MDAFIKKLCDKYKVLESDVQTLLGCMEEYGGHITTKTEQMPPSGSLQTEKQLSPSGDMQTMLIH